MIDTTNGTVLAVATVTLGDELAADAATGSTTITVTDAADFAETGGTLMLNGQLIDYTACDDETGEITLVDPLASDGTDGDAVSLADPSGALASELRATVQVIGTLDSDEPIEAIIAHPIVPLLPEGIRDPGTGESVTLELLPGEEWQLVNVHGRKPVFDADNAPTGFLIAAQPPASVASPDNTAETGKTYRMPRYSPDDVVFAYGKTGDAFPQVMFFCSMGQGIYFGDGTSDPASGSVNIFVEDNGLVFAAGSNGLQMTDSTARLFLDAAASDGKAILRGDDEGSLYITPGSSQTAPPIVVTEPNSSGPVLTVEMDGTVELHGAGVGIVMASPDGTRYRATMANGGTWSIAPA